MGLTPDPPGPWPDAADWTPWRIEPAPGGPVVSWCHTAGIEFDDPFFTETVRRAQHHPFRLLVERRTALADVAADAARAPSLPVAGLVLHMSRCGSTLVARVLDALSSTLVLSEPAPVDEVLRLAATVPGVGPAEVRGVVEALARPRAAGQRSCVLKLDAWAVLDLPLLRRALPGVPWVFVHRDGAEVLASHRRVRGWHVIPGTLDPAETGAGPDEHAARVLGRLCRAAADHVGPDGRAVDHRDLPGAVADVIAPHFGLEVDAAGRDAMAAAAGRDAKNPFLAYEGSPPVPDDAGLRAAAARWIEPARAAL